MSFGQELRKLRESQGLTRRELEDRSGISQRQIEYLEKNEKDPRRETLEALARVLGPEIIRAAFPELVAMISSGSKNRATARYLTRAIWGIPDETLDLAHAGR